MANAFQVTFDAASPRRLGDFYCEVLGYVEQPPPPGFATWDDALDSMGIDRSDPDRAYAIVDPAGNGARVFFQKVPESKSAKNRVHLDVNVGKDVMHQRAKELVELGAEYIDEYDEPGGHWIAMRDPEGNEFCIQ
jgi:hypothetical protein